MLVLVTLHSWSDCGEAVSSLDGKEGPPVSECFRCREVAGGVKRALGGVEGCLALLEKESLVEMSGGYPTRSSTSNMTHC